MVKDKRGMKHALKYSQEYILNFLIERGVLSESREKLIQELRNNTNYEPREIMELINSYFKWREALPEFSLRINQRLDEASERYGTEFQKVGKKVLGIIKRDNQNLVVDVSGINEMVYQQEPGSIIWCVRDDGVLAALTYQRSENVIAWSRHIFGGVFGTGDAVCESAATISGDLTEDEVWVIIKRTVNGATKRYVECFSDFDFDETDPTDFKFLDSHLSYSGSSTTTLSGLSHLEGQAVSILADGSVHANKTVSSGAITLDRAVTKACVGLSYDSILQTMRIEGGAAEGTSQGKTKRISKVVLRLFETVGVKVGPSLSNLELVPFRTTSSNLSAPVDTLLAGDKEIEFRDDYNSDGFIIIKQDQPLPCSVLAIYPTLVTSDG